MRTYLEHMTKTELLARGKRLAAMVAESKARLARGEKGTGPATQVMVKGSWRACCSLEHALNNQTGALEMTRREWSRRGYGANVN